MKKGNPRMNFLFNCFVHKSYSHKFQIFPFFFSLPSLAKYLGLEGEVETPRMEPYDVEQLQGGGSSTSGSESGGNMEEEGFPEEMSPDEPGNLRHR